MASASNAKNVAAEVPGDANFDLSHVFTTDGAAALRMYGYLPNPECNANPSSPSLVDRSRACQTPAFEGWVAEDTHAVPMQLLNLGKQDEVDLRNLHPNVKVRANCITPNHYIFVVKRLLFWYEVTNKSLVGVPHPQAFARLLHRMTQDMRNSPPCGFQFAYCSDPFDSIGCLNEMLLDIEETKERLKVSEGSNSLDRYVYVGRECDIYIQCLIAIATQLDTRVFDSSEN